MGSKGPNFDRVRAIASAVAAEDGGTPAWRHSTGVRVPARQSEALLRARLLFTDLRQVITNGVELSTLLRGYEVSGLVKIDQETTGML